MPALHGLVTGSVARAVGVNSTSGPPVICAWPVSGQYGIGSRILYYILVAACVFARKAVWIRNACLAAALLVPAVAALHGIVLAALHNPDAVDLDVYGAFQLCAIGILAAPVTVRHSRTYFFDPSRNTIFLWTGLILAGLLSLTVEFYRLSPAHCPVDNKGNPISANISPKAFLKLQANCNITCDPVLGPFSSMRRGSANDIYIVPVPSTLSFNAATLMAAACCIPAILSMISMWNRILEINWHSRFAPEDENEQIDGTNGATVGTMKGINALIGVFLSTIEIPLFIAAILAILFVGEKNFFSHQLSYMTEPMQSIGQWAPVVGTGLAMAGSLLQFLVKEQETDPEQNPEMGLVHCCCTEHRHRPCRESCRPPSDHFSPRVSHDDNPEIAAVDSAESSTAPGRRHTAPDIRPAVTNGTSEDAKKLTRNRTVGFNDDVGNRRKVARVLNRMSDYIGTAAPGHFDDSEFRRGPADDFPRIPAEELRNPDLFRFLESYNPTRDADGNATPVCRTGAASFVTTASSAGNDAEEGPSSSATEGPAFPGIVHSPTLAVPSQSFHRRSFSSIATRPRHSSVPVTPLPSITRSSFRPGEAPGNVVNAEPKAEDTPSTPKSLEPI